MRTVGKNPSASIRSSIVFVVFLCMLLVSACATRDSGPRRDTFIDDSSRVSDFPPGMSGGGLRDGAVTRLQPPSFPWQIWQSQHDLSGQPLDNIFLLEGDQLFDQSQFRAALEKFKEAKTLATSKNEKDAIIIREASSQLALGNPAGALRVLSNYFRRSGRAEESVTAPFSLLFAYAYGSRGDVDQSLAWFSRTNRLHAGVGGYHEAAENGIRGLLRVPSTSQIAELGTRWKTDSLISLLIGQELRRRSQPDYIPPDRAPTFVRFWQQGPGHSVMIGRSPVGDGTKTVLGVILPLSGQHSSLGQKVRNGIELAYLGQEAEQDFVLDFRDSMGESLRAMSEYRQFVDSNTPAIVLGPLLSEPAAAVRDIARNSPLPVMVFSKRSSFETGPNVFRLGPTLQSQITSLLQKAITAKNMKRFLVVTPFGAIGEFYQSVFAQEAAYMGAEIVYQAEYAPGNDAELVALATEVELIEGDALFFPGSLKEASRFVGNLSRRKREQLPLLGLGTWDNPGELKKSRAILDGALFVSPFHLDSEREVVKKFKEAYQRKYGVIPDFLAAQGFDAATLAIAAYRQSQALSIPYEDGLKSVEAYEGLTGLITVRRNGELQRTFQVLELAQGKPQLVRPRQRESQSSETVTPSYVYHGDTAVQAPRSSPQYGQFR